MYSYNTSPAVNADFEAHLYPGDKNEVEGGLELYMPIGSSP